jgi:trehalose-6-phosphate synthase
MHDLPEYAIYLAEHHEQFNEFNKQISAQINAVSAEKQYFFIQDYQLGLAPKQLTQKGHRAVIFWHTPWPKHVPSKFSPPIRELARGLLGASA